MHLGFNLSLNDEKKQYIQAGKNVVMEQIASVHAKLAEYTSQNGKLNGNRIQEDWFPQVQCDAFISHSHGDGDKALGLAGWLKEKFGIIALVDSTVWGYADVLLKQIDDNRCRTKDGLYYDYRLRNNSTSHVHLMLSIALAKMIERTECLFFLNPNSITAEDSISRTKSPWIYYEIGISAVLAKKKIVNEGLGSVDIDYKLDDDHLIQINNFHLETWYKQYTKISPKNNLPPLEILYQQFGKRGGGLTLQLKKYK